MAELWDVRSRVNVDLFRLLLVGYDEIESFFALDGLTYGFSMGLDLDSSLLPECLWKESFRSPEAHSRISEYFNDKRRMGRVSGPFSAPPHGKAWAGAVVFPVSQIPKSSGGNRTINNLSAGGSTWSVNGFVPKSTRTTDYPTFRQVAASLVAIRLDLVFMAIFDCETAFRQLSLNPDNWKFSIIAFRDRFGNRCYYIDTALVFGAAANPRIFNKVGDAICFILKSLCFDPPSGTPVLRVFQLLLRYLDDFLILGVSRSDTDRLLDAMLLVMEALNFPVKKPSKTLRA